MIICRPGRISERIHLLGRRESLLYLFSDGNESIILGGGMAHIIPEVIEQIASFCADERLIRKVVILHSHFDHCGLVPLFKKRWPWIEVLASKRAVDLLGRDDISQTISFLNRILLEEYKREDLARDYPEIFEKISVDRPLQDGDHIYCGRCRLEVIATPGHSSCSISLYSPDEKAIFVSDAGGLPNGERIFTAANSDFDLYLKSLDRLAGYDVSLYLPEHYHGIAGEKASEFFVRSKEAALEMKQLLLSTYEKTGDIKKSAELIIDFMTGSTGTPIIPKKVIGIVVEQMLSNLLKKSSKNP